MRLTVPQIQLRVQYTTENKVLRPDATYLPLRSMFFLSPQSKDFHYVIPKLYFHVIQLYNIFLFGYIVSIENIYYDFIIMHLIAFCMQFKEKIRIF